MTRRDPVRTIYKDIHPVPRRSRNWMLFCWICMQVSVAAGYYLIKAL